MLTHVTEIPRGDTQTSDQRLCVENAVTFLFLFGETQHCTKRIV